MNDLTLNTENATETTLPATPAIPAIPAIPGLTPADTLQLVTKALARSLAKVAVLDGQLGDQTIAVSTAKQRLTEVLANGGTGFDDASRVYKQANNKLDKLLEGREALVVAAQTELDKVRDATADVSVQLRSLEA